MAAFRVQVFQKKRRRCFVRECSKSISRRLHDPDFINHYFSGKGLDIGGRPDPLGMYRGLFRLMTEVRTWDKEDGDAKLLAGVPDASFDFVHSSHCLEHLDDPLEALRNWLRVVVPGGYLIVTVPDEDMYEQGVFPSTFNTEHKWTFTIFKKRSWSVKSRNVVDLIAGLGEEAELVKLIKLSSTYRYDLPRYDQTVTPVAECGIEFVVRKRTLSEISAGGRYNAQNSSQPAPEERAHLNQFVKDRAAIIKMNSEQPPFVDDGPIRERGPA